jgi:hypothetical protein
LSVSVEQQLYQGLVGTPAFVALVGADAGGNPAFYDKGLPQQIFTTLASPTPFVAGVYQRIASPRLFFQGPGPLQATMGRARFQLIFWSNAKNGTVILDQIDKAVLAYFQTADFVNPPGSPATFVQASFIAYSSRTLIEPQAQPTLQKLEIDATFWFADQ